MDKKRADVFNYISKSGFVRSVFMRVLSIFIIASIIISSIMFVSFTSEISKNILSERMTQLSVIENTISTRMGEINSIAYNISTDPTFYMESAVGANSGYEMSNTLARYLVGNSFIEHLAYYRLSEPDTIYVSSGERSLSEFFGSSYGLSKDEVNANIEGIRSAKETKLRLISYGSDEYSYFSYLYPRPQLSPTPKAFVLMLIPVKEVKPLLESLLGDVEGKVAVFDPEGNEIYKMNTLSEDVPIEDYLKAKTADEEAISFNGEKYILQRVISKTNGWSYVSLIRQTDTFSGLANKQLFAIVLLLLLVFVATFAMFACIIIQFKPISALAETVAENAPDAVKPGETVDERALLSNTIATLKNDSEQKQHFENAYREAEAANKAKSAFLSNMSHYIRTPMNAAIGMTDLALRHADDEAYVRDCLRKVQISSKYLLDIINNVLDMSRIESGRFQLSSEVIDLSSLIESLRALLQSSADAKNRVSM